MVGIGASTSTGAGVGVGFGVGSIDTTCHDMGSSLGRVKSQDRPRQEEFCVVLSCLCFELALALALALAVVVKHVGIATGNGIITCWNRY
jgi:hypothetical protein